MKCLGDSYFSPEELKDAGFAKLGKNVKIHKRASLYGLENIEIGDSVRIDDFTVIIATGKLEIGHFVSIPNFCFLGAKKGITIGNFVTFAPGVKVFTASDDYQGHYLTGVAVPSEMTGGKQAPVAICDHVIIGAGSIILPGCTLQEGCSVGALSLVKTNLEGWSIYAGIPAEWKKERSKALLRLADQLTSR